MEEMGKMEKTYVDMLTHLNFDIESTLNKINALDYCIRVLNDFKAQDAFEQADEGNHYEFPANILILADRLLGLGIGLSYFLSKCCNANVLGVAANYQEAEVAAGEYPIDYLIIVGYQKNRDNYRIISTLRERVKPPHIVIWASLDQHIFNECIVYKIYESFDREKPLGEFVDFLKRRKKIKWPCD